METTTFVRIWFALVVPLILIAGGVSYYLTRSTGVAIGAGVTFFVALLIGWFIAGRTST